ncbi:MAG: hypothetical protein COB26_00775 [Piscirickettsiaceae bacterium]|nr:MAG: hypothetical protein COB26_02300 [Piscirickettsiaceae bacterium]PCI71919.1 MAG: hypothetical protein COB26_00775 [Piscirickettsiaceae bacterium]
MNNKLCNCGSSKLFSLCCEPLLCDIKLPSTAEQLMRSRFTAFCIHHHQYLVDTQYPGKRTTNKFDKLQQNSEPTIWVKLTILQTHQGQAEDNTGSVNFSALFNENNQFYKLNEHSTFIKENQQWYYLDGQPTVEETTLKLKRNEPCWCGSAIKYKSCHLK